MLGTRIGEIRMQYGWSQVKLAEKLGVAKQTVSNWENENIQPSVEMLVRISKMFNVSADYLLGIDDGPRLDVEGLPTYVVAHISQLIEDYKSALAPVR